MLSSESHPQPSQPKTVPNGCQEYQVQSRDTLRSIAVNFDTTTSNIMKLNRLSSTLIFPGQILHVPDITNEPGFTNENQPTSSSFDGEFSFLKPLSVSPTETNDKSDFQKLILDPFGSEQSDPNSNNRLEIKHTDPTRFGNLIELTSLDVDLKAAQPERKTSTKSNDESPKDVVDETHGSRKSIDRQRIISCDSNASDTFEENFLKMKVCYVTPTQDSVEGVLLITPTSLMFDPNPLDPLAAAFGCDKFGIMCTMPSIITATMFNDQVTYAKYSCHDSRPGSSLQDKGASTTPHAVDDLIDLEEHVVTTEPVSLSEQFETTVNVGESKRPQTDVPQNSENAEDKLMKEFPLLHHLAKTVEGMIPGTEMVNHGDEDFPSPESRNSMFFCVRSKLPMMKTFMRNNNVDDKGGEAKQPDDEEPLKEGWFKVPKSRSDQLLAFFMQWTPDPYALDFAEQRGFVITDRLSVDGNTPSKCDLPSDERRGRSSTNASLEFVDDFYGEAQIEKEWEIVSIEEARRRSTLNALELANDDTSLMPELLDSSHLLNDSSVLSLCKNLPARCVGCPWKLLYSTFEHGMSLRTLYRKMSRVAEDSPTAIIVQDSEGHIFGAVSSCPPQISEHFKGTGEGFLFTLEPSLQIFSWTGENMFFMKGDTDSLTIGGGDGLSGLWLDGDLCHGSSHTCLTFNNAVLSSSEDFFIQGVEVWGFCDT